MSTRPQTVGVAGQFPLLLRPPRFGHLARADERCCDSRPGLAELAGKIAKAAVAVAAHFGPMVVLVGIQCLDDLYSLFQFPS